MPFNAHRNASAPGKGKTALILIVDDDSEWRTALRTLLEHEGYYVDEAENGEIALQRVGARPPDLVLLDVSMPVMDGFETAKRLRKQGGPPLLAVSGTDRSPGEGRKMRDLFDGHVRKPASTTVLLGRIAGLLNRTAGDHSERGPPQERACT